jgi:RNA-binding protein
VKRTRADARVAVEVPGPAPVLTKRQLKDFRAQAHHLEPLVQIGHQGLHEAAFAAVARALRDHELIKVRLHEPEDKDAMAQALADATKAALCGLVGHTVILYKPKPKPARAAKG